MNRQKIEIRRIKILNNADIIIFDDFDYKRWLEKVLGITGIV